MQQQSFHMWPWQEEAVSVTEYAYALHGLNRFLTQVEVREPQTLKEVVRDIVSALILTF